MCGDDLVADVCVRIAARDGVGAATASAWRLVKEGKQLDPALPCGLRPGDTVHVLARLGGGARILRRRGMVHADPTSLPAAPSVCFYQGEAHGGAPRAAAGRNTPGPRALPGSRMLERPPEEPRSGRTR